MIEVVPTHEVGGPGAGLIETSEALGGKLGAVLMANIYNSYDDDRLNEYGFLYVSDGSAAQRNREARSAEIFLDSKIREART